MVKKKRTAKQLAADKARSEKMKALTAPEQVLQAPNTGDLQKQIDELKALLAQQPQGSAQLTDRGIVGTRDRYIMDPSNYPDPRERLQAEARLKRFAFGENYELGWEVVPTRYQTIDGVWQQEPKFTLELIGVVFDEETGDPTTRRYIMRRGIFFEDPEASIIEATQRGMEIDQTNQKLFLDEMRYLRFRDWLVEFFYPPTSTVKKDKKEMVIGNQLVETWEVTSDKAEGINFSALKSKF